MIKYLILRHWLVNNVWVTAIKAALDGNYFDLNMD